MQELRERARLLVLSVLAAGVISLGAPCGAQEPDPPTPPGVGGDGRGSLFAPSAWLVVGVPVREQIDLKIYGFYIGEMNVPVAQVDLPIRTAKFLTITPSYMGYRVPASGLNRLTPQLGRFTDSYDEHQFRIDGTVPFTIRNFEISGRAMYVRRFRPTPAGDINRFRGRVTISYPLAVRGRMVKPFASYETYHDQPAGAGWNRNRVWSGVTLQLTKQVFVQPSYLWETSEGNRNVNYLLFGLIVNTK